MMAPTVKRRKGTKKGKTYKYADHSIRSPCHVIARKRARHELAAGTLIDVIFADFFLFPQSHHGCPAVLGKAKFQEPKSVPMLIDQSNGSTVAANPRTAEAQDDSAEY